MWQKPKYCLADELLNTQVVWTSASVTHEVCGRARSTVEIIELLTIL